MVQYILDVQCERAGLDLGIDVEDVVDGSGSNALIYGVVPKNGVDMCSIYTRTICIRGLTYTFYCRTVQSPTVRYCSVRYGIIFPQ